MKNNKKQNDKLNNEVSQNTSVDETISNLFFANVSDDVSSDNAVSDEAHANEIHSVDTASDEAPANETLSVDADSDKTIANETLSVDAASDKTIANETLSVDAASDKTIANETLSVDAASDKTIANETLSVDAASDKTISGESISNNQVERNTKVNSIRKNADERRNLAPKQAKARKPFMPIVIACLILAIVVGGIAYILSNGKSDKKDSLAANKSLFDGLFDFTSPVDSALDIDGFMADFTKHGSIESSLTLENLYADTDISGITLNSTFNHNLSSKEASFNADMTYRGIKLPSVLTYVNAKKAMIKIPSFDESVYTYSNEILKNIFESYYDIDIISLYVYAIKETYPDDFKTILSGITCENANNDSYGNKGITYTISENSVKLFISKLITVTFDNKELFSHIESLYEKDEISDLKKQVEYVSRLASKEYSGDITCTIWKNTKGQLTNFDFHNVIEESGNEVNIDFTIESYDETNPSDSMTFTLNIFDSYEDYSLIYDRTKEAEDNTTYLSHDISVIADSDSILDLSLSEDFNSDSNDYDIEATINGDTIVVLTGTFNEIKKGKSFNYDLTKFQITQGYNNLITLTGNLKADSDKPKIKKPSGTIVDINSLSGSEKDEVMKRLSDFLTKSIPE